MSLEQLPVGDYQMPTLGLGLWKIAPEDTAASVVTAIKLGYRHLDSAMDYGNEAAVGEGIRAAIDQGLCKREDLWVTSKLWNTCHEPQRVEAGFQRTLDDLGLDYLDLYLIHFPIAQPFVPFDQHFPPGWLTEENQDPPRMQLAPVPLHETWQAMEALQTSGRTRTIGVCNYNTGLLQDLLNYATVKPAMLQIEAHPFLTQDNLIRFAHDNDVAVTAFSPLGALSYVELGMAGAADTVLTAAAVVEAAARLDRTPAQVVLRWAVQRGTSLIPKTSRVERLQENAALFDFALSDEEMMAISALNQNRRFNDPAVFCEQAFGRFQPIYD